MSAAFDNLRQQLKRLPGLGHRSAERAALHLLVTEPAALPALVNALNEAARVLRRCSLCGNLSEAALCPVCADEKRDPARLCAVEHIPDLIAFERSGAYRGRYHVLHGKLSPVSGVGPAQLNLQPLLDRLATEPVDELILALSNDIEGEATCHYITQHLPKRETPLAVTRIGFGLPSGGSVPYADPGTLKNALESRRGYA
ncbi:MAG: recombination mediator RecR [Opitutaceae bacterium]|jgi:recombination protein RecR|nr:recombination mediator RecR [Opitutaceae bacterium]